MTLFCKKVGQFRRRAGNNITVLSSLLIGLESQRKCVFSFSESKHSNICTLTQSLIDTTIHPALGESPIVAEVHKNFLAFLLVTRLPPTIER